ncbi:chain length determinant protein EpsF [Denitromonas ohlonensis]|uniref:Chain length determinant protein EpsF n=2 Tax=Denitromonas TaxID=139331 RepID=A0A557SKN6_9RHOO|nr:chain length determinant protein EpsF [Denitromonas ohlonensis]TVO68099.1 chain length determinant protein EpsF [Denitromonas ohlonensis]TVO77996.1 chain length determinant protein EpsF [Denitromonas ohlonensis]
MSFQQFLLILRARLWLVLATLAVVVGTTLAVSLILPKQYTAEVALVVDAKSADPLLGGLLPAQMIPGYMATQVDIISSDRVAQRVVGLLKMDQSPVVQEQWREDTDGEGSIKVWLAELLKKKLDVKPSRESNVITIGYQGTDPGFAAGVANTFAQAYIDVSLELKVEPARQYAKWFDGQTNSLRADLEVAQKKLSEYQQERGIIATDERLDVETARLAELSTQLSMAQAQRVDSRSRQTQGGSAESLPEVMQNGLIQSLKSDLSRQEATRMQMAGRLGANHPELARIDAEISSLRDRIATETRRVVSSLGTTNRVNVQRVTEVEAALEAQKQKILDLKAQRDQIAVFQRDVENAQRAYDLVTQRLAQTSLESQTQQTNVVVLSPAVAPLKPSSPKVLLNTALAVFLGMLLGVGAALLLELMDQRVRGEEDLTLLDGVPMLGTIPASGKTGAFRHAAA